MEKFRRSKNDEGDKSREKKEPKIFLLGVGRCGAHDHKDRPKKRFPFEREFCEFVCGLYDNAYDGGGNSIKEGLHPDKSAIGDIEHTQDDDHQKRWSDKC